MCKFATLVMGAIISIGLLTASYAGGFPTGNYSPAARYYAPVANTCDPHTIYYTPDEEPYGYYVCYHLMSIFQISYSHHSHRYDRFRYHGCTISYKPCNLDCRHNLTFGWFPTTFQAKNALYRCKENF